MLSRLLADVVVVIHLAYLVFIPVGGFLAWRWRRLIPVHLAAVGVGLLSITVGFECPLTTWEKSLRRAGGETPYSGGFIDHYLTGRLFPHGLDTVVQLAIALAVVSAYAGRLLRNRGRVAARPHWKVGDGRERL
jgi:hypothetical protein